MTKGKKMSTGFGNVYPLALENIRCSFGFFLPLLFNATDTRFGSRAKRRPGS